MRLWSIHPGYLDAKGLVALWREALLAQNVLLGKTKGYKNHPQLIRFKNTSNPSGAMAEYLKVVADEADKRGYRFDNSKIAHQSFENKIVVTSGQVKYEFDHLLAKLKERAPDCYRQLKKTGSITVHPLFEEIGGEIEEWEIIR